MRYVHGIGIGKIQGDSQKYPQRRADRQVAVVNVLLFQTKPEMQQKSKCNRFNTQNSLVGNTTCD